VTIVAAADQRDVAAARNLARLGGLDDAGNDEQGDEAREALY
jgi:hypothetical protein